MLWVFTSSLNIKSYSNAILQFHQGADILLYYCGDNYTVIPSPVSLTLDILLIFVSVFKNQIQFISSADKWNRNRLVLRKEKVAFNHFNEVIKIFCSFRFLGSILSSGYFLHGFHLPVVQFPPNSQKHTSRWIAPKCVWVVGVSSIKKWMNVLINLYTTFNRRRFTEIAI